MAENACQFQSPEVMQLPRISSKVECMVLGSFTETPVPGRKKSFQNNRFVSRESRAHDVTAYGHVSVRGSGDVSVGKQIVSKVQSHNNLRMSEFKK